MSFQKFLSVVCLLALASCASPGPSARVTLADGRKLIVNLQDGRIAGEESKHMSVQTARFMYNVQQKQGKYVFVLYFPDGSVPTSIKIEDITGSKPEIMVQDQKPVLKDRIWFTGCPSLSLDDPSLKWMHDIDDSFRIYRFTVVLQDGTEIVLHQASVYPGFAKAGLISASEAKAP